ncbi:hypothetical protein KJ641_02735 [Patescibacteria group bacterium]|nr:hypothetical protein [Patescibacteria group bacterium]MBU1895761.1 hypothetical protein [Patescibacteria group bacterium]
MYLLIDLAEKDLIHVSLFDQKKIVERSFSGPNRDLLLSVSKFLEEEKFKKENIKGIMVVVGEGGFTSTRLAVTVANTFGYVLHIPLLAINRDQVEDVQSLIPKLLKQTAGKYISATYSGEPNIGKKINNIWAKSQK